MKIYFSKYFDDYIFVIGGQPYIFVMQPHSDNLWQAEVNHQHLKNSRMHKREEDKEVIYICTVKD